MNRRILLKGAAGLGAVAGVGGLARFGLVAPPRSNHLESVDSLAARVFSALPDDARRRACVAFDDPLRQCHNRGLGMGGLSINAASLDWDTRCVLTDLLHAGLSEQGRLRLAKQDLTRFAGVNSMQLLICGNPTAGPYQVVLSGVHLNLRLGRANRDGIAFGGPQVYGDQRGNEVRGLPGNVYRYQMEAAHRLIAALTPAERTAVRVPVAPAQVNIGLQGRAGRFDGLPVAELAADKRELAREIVAGILSTYNDDDASFAWSCLEHNGGVDALRFADYEEDFDGSRRAGDAPSQIFRLEGPAAVLHFRGEPHVHAFVNVAMDGERPLSLGDVVAENSAVLEGESLRAFYETAMRAQASADVAYYPAWSVVGRLRAGTIRTGDVWAAESWVNDLVVVEAKGEDLAPELADRMRLRGVAPQARSTYRIATADYVAQYEARERLGRVGAARPLGLLRDALVAHAREHGFGRDA
jgi:uncharacterized protein DUF3500